MYANKLTAGHARAVLSLSDEARGFGWLTV